AATTADLGINKLSTNNTINGISAASANGGPIAVTQAGVSAAVDVSTAEDAQVAAQTLTVTDVDGATVGTLNVAQGDSAAQIEAAFTAAGLTGVTATNNANSVT